MMNHIKETPAYVSELNPNEVFVFGSNLNGIHGAGAAKLARDKFGAVIGVGEGLTGSSYALPTIGRFFEILPISDIKTHVDRLKTIVESNPDKLFLITAVGCGLATYSAKDIAPLFKDFTILPNMTLPKSFITMLI